MRTNKESSRRFRLDRTTLFGLTMVAIGILLSVFGTITTTTITPSSPETCACPAVGTCDCTSINPATTSVTNDYTLNSLGLLILVIGLFFTIAHSFGVDLF